MIQYILLLAYLLGGELKVEQKVYKTMDECNEKGQQVILSIKTNPKFDEGVVAMCVQAVVKES